MCRTCVGEGHCCFEVLFFFSSRRRHTRYWRDWSSDVCSSDLGQEATLCGGASPLLANREEPTRRSEERRVGKECRSRWSTYHEKKRKTTPSPASARSPTDRPGLFARPITSCYLCILASGLCAT